MSDQPSPAPSGDSPRASNAASISGPAPNALPPTLLPRTQQRTNHRSRWPLWAKELPYLRMPSANPEFQLIDHAGLEATLKGADAGEVKRIEDDIAFMEHELMRLFRQQDREAAVQQNRYRLYQIGYILLATLATLVGSFQALALGGRRDLMPWFAFIETMIALLATFLATISGREPPLEKYLNSRRRAESLRREYFRFLMNLPPYDGVAGAQRRMMLSARAADINRGVFPGEGSK